MNENSAQKIPKFEQEMSNWKTLLEVGVFYWNKATAQLEWLNGIFWQVQGAGYVLNQEKLSHYIPSQDLRP